MANDTRMKQMEWQLQQVTASLVEVHNRVETLEEKIGSMVDRKLEVVAEKLRGEMRHQIKQEMQKQGNLLHDQLQQFMLMFSSQHQVSISPDFPPKDWLKPILPRIGTSNQNAGSPGSLEFQVDPATVVENVLEKREEITIGRARKFEFLAIAGDGMLGGLEGGFDNNEPEYEEAYNIVILPDYISLSFPSVELPEQVRLAVDAILMAEGAERKEQVASWAADKKQISPYATDLQQLDHGVTVPPSGWKCAKCDKTENLWLNLTDGMILCGRRNWDGSGGNNHAIEHYNETGYPLAVKLGTITADLDAADVFSYPEDESVLDPLLGQHLAFFGIDFSSLQKTEILTAVIIIFVSIEEKKKPRRRKREKEVKQKMKVGVG